MEENMALPTPTGSTIPFVAQPQPLQSQQSLRDMYAAAMAPQVNFQRSQGQPGGLAMGKQGRNPFIAQSPWGQQGQSNPSAMQNALTGMFTQV